MLKRRSLENSAKINVMMKRLIARVYGHVQGVFFRDTTRRHAQRLQISGWVRNEPDGSVEVVAEGQKEALEQLVAFLEKGPPSARVKRVDVKWSDALGDMDGFRIRW